MDKTSGMLHCEKHSKKVMTICTLAECKEKKLCSDCFKTHDALHIKNFRHLDDLDNLKLNELFKEICAQNIFNLEEREEIRIKVYKNLEASINKFITEVSSAMWEYYRNKIELSIQEFESSINKSVSEMEHLLNFLNINDDVQYKASICVKIEEQNEGLKSINENFIQDIGDIQSAINKNLNKVKNEIFNNNYLPKKIKIEFGESSKLRNKCKIIFDENIEECHQLTLNEDGVMSLKSLDGIFKKKTSTITINTDEKPIKFLNNHNVNSLIKIRNKFYFLNDDLSFNYYINSPGKCEKVESLSLSKHDIKNHSMLKYKDNIILVYSTKSDQVNLAYYDLNLQMVKEKETAIKMSSNFYAFQMLENIYLINLESWKIEYCYSLSDESIYKMNLEIIIKEKEYVSYYNGKLYLVDKNGNLNVLKMIVS